MIVVEQDGTVLRCQGCRATYEMSQHTNAKWVRDGFADYHALCALAPDVRSARAVIRDRKRRAYYAQAQHRARFGSMAVTQNASGA